MRIYGSIILLLVQLGLCAQRTQVLGFRNHGQEQKFYALDFRFNPPKKVLLVDELAIMGQAWGDSIVNEDYHPQKNVPWKGTSYFRILGLDEKLNARNHHVNVAFLNKRYYIFVPTFNYRTQDYSSLVKSQLNNYLDNNKNSDIKYVFHHFENARQVLGKVCFTRYILVNENIYFATDPGSLFTASGAERDYEWFFPVTKIDSIIMLNLTGGQQNQSHTDLGTRFRNNYWFDLDFYRNHDEKTFYSIPAQKFCGGRGSFGESAAICQITDTSIIPGSPPACPPILSSDDYNDYPFQYPEGQFCGSENRFLWRFQETKSVKHSTLWLYERASPESAPQIVRELRIPESPGEMRRLSSFRSNTAGTYAYVAVKSHLEGQDSQEHRLFQFDLRNNTPPVLMHRFATDLQDTLLLPVVYRLPNGKIYIGFHSRHYPNTDRKRGYNIIHEPDRPFPDCRLELDEEWVEMLGDYGEIHFDGWDSKIMGFKEEVVCNGELKLINQSDTSIFKEFVWYSEEGDSVNSTAQDLQATIRLSKPGKQLIFLKGISEEGYIQWFERTVDYPEAYWLPEPRFSLTDSIGCQWVEQQVTDLTRHPEQPSYTATMHWGDGHSVQFLPGDPPNEHIALRHTYTQEGKYQLYMVLAKNQCRDTFAQELRIEILPAPRPGILIDTLRLCESGSFDFGRLYTDSLRSVQWQLSGPQNRDTFFAFEPPLSVSQEAPLWRLSGLAAGKYLLKQSLIGASSCVNTDSMPLQVMPDLPNALPEFTHIQVHESAIRVHAKMFEGLNMRLLPDNLLSGNGRFDLPANDTQSRAVELRFENHCAEMATEGSSAYLPAITGQMTQVGENHIRYHSTDIPARSTYLSIQSRRGVSEVMVSEGSNLLHMDVYEAENENTRCYRLVQEHPEGDTSFSRETCLDVPFLLFIPNAFSPDGDGLNDFWKPLTAGTEWVHLRIYDRWGGLMHEEKGISPQWDGQNAQAGMYAYTLEVRSAEGKSFFKNGSVQLVR